MADVIQCYGNRKAPELYCATINVKCATIMGSIKLLRIDFLYLFPLKGELTVG